jgi:hypothetical protein
MSGELRGNVAAAFIAVLALIVAVAVAMVVDSGPDGSSATATDAPDAATDSAGTSAAQEVSYPAVTAVPVVHHGEYDVQYDDLPPETQAQLDVVRGIIERYPTVADATADGWKTATTNLVGIAAHFLHNGPIGFTQFDRGFDVNEPEALLFDGTEPDSPIVGVSYLASGAEAPEGFSGPWDVWHRHDAVCFAGGLVIAEVGGHPDSKISISADDCKGQGGIIFPISNLSMIHVWMKPGYPSETGVFAHDHSDLD